MAAALATAAATATAATTTAATAAAAAAAAAAAVVSLLMPQSLLSKAACYGSSLLALHLTFANVILLQNYNESAHIYIYYYLSALKINFTATLKIIILMLLFRKIIFYSYNMTSKMLVTQI